MSKYFQPSPIDNHKDESEGELKGKEVFVMMVLGSESLDPSGGRYRGLSDGCEDEEAECKDPESGGANK